MFSKMVLSKRRTDLTHNASLVRLGRLYDGLSLKCESCNGKWYLNIFLAKEVDPKLQLIHALKAKVPLPPVLLLLKPGEVPLELLVLLFGLLGLACCACCAVTRVGRRATRPWSNVTLRRWHRLGRGHVRWEGVGVHGGAGRHGAWHAHWMHEGTGAKGAGAAHLLLLERPQKSSV